MANQSQPVGCVDLCSPVRNRYFYGKLLDVFHFELEQDYFNIKRWLLNRLVAGYGVVCGLGVSLGPDNQSVVVSPGVAIDKCGHEIIVCHPSDPFPLPPPPSAPPPGGSGSSPSASNPTSPTAADCCDTGTYYHLSLCYLECQADPVPALGGDCDTQALCTPGAIRERYKLGLDEGKLCPASTTSRIPDAIANGQVVYSVLVNYVSNPCPDPCDDCCIPLANICLPDPGKSYDQNSIDITVRPIVYTNDVLYELILAMNQGQAQARGGKP